MKQWTKRYVFLVVIILSFSSSAYGLLLEPNRFYSELSGRSNTGVFSTNKINLDTLADGSAFDAYHSNGSLMNTQWEWDYNSVDLSATFEVMAFLGGNSNDFGRWTLFMDFTAETDGLYSASVTDFLPIGSNNEQEYYYEASMYIGDLDHFGVEQIISLKDGQPLTSTNDLWTWSDWDGNSNRTLEYILQEGHRYVARIDVTTLDNNFSPTALSSDISLSGKLNVSISDNAVVPIPASVWLFGSGLIGLIGVARRKKA